jgi:hypothetical protein
MLVRNLLYEGKERQRMSCCHGQIALSELLQPEFIGGQLRWCRWDLIVLPHLHGAGVLCAGVWVIYLAVRDEGLMNSSLCQWFHGCCQFFMMTVDVFCGYITVCPHNTDTENGQCHVTSSDRPMTLAEFPLVWNSRNAIEFEWKVGGLSVVGFFFMIWNIEGSGLLAMNPGSHTVRVEQILQF